MARDLTTALDPIEARRRQALLTPPMVVAADPNEGADYPRMLFSKAYVDAERAWRDAIDPLEQQQHAEAMKRGYVLVFSLEEEDEYLQEGYKSSPADHMAVDPRIPVGREARKSLAARRLSDADELRALRRRYAGLTGRNLEEEPEPAPVEAVVIGSTTSAMHTADQEKAPASARRRGRPPRVASTTASVQSAA